MVAGPGAFVLAGQPRTPGLRYLGEHERPGALLEILDLEGRFLRPRKAGLNRAPAFRG